MKSKQDLRYLISNDKTGSCIERQFQFFGLNQTIQLTFDVHFFKTGQESWTLTAETGRRIHLNTNASEKCCSCGMVNTKQSLEIRQINMQAVSRQLCQL